MSDRACGLVTWAAIILVIVTAAVCVHGWTLSVHGQRLREVEARLKAMEASRDD